MSIRFYGFFMPITVFFLIGVCAVVCDIMYGSAFAAGLTATVALGLGFAQKFFEDSIEKDNNYRNNGNFTADQLVDYTLLTAVFTALISMVIGVWITPASGFLIVPVMFAALATGAWTYAWVKEERRMDRTDSPIHEDFGAPIWITPFATGGFLILSFYGHATLALGILVVNFVLFFLSMVWEIHYGVPKKVPVTQHKHSQRKPEHVIRSEAGQ